LRQARNRGLEKYGSYSSAGYSKTDFLFSENVDLNDLSIVVGLYEKLEAGRFVSAVDLEQWMLERSELDAALSKQGQFYISA